MRQWHKHVKPPTGRSSIYGGNGAADRIWRLIFSSEKAKAAFAAAMTLEGATTGA